MILLESFPFFHMTGELRSYNQILYSYIFHKKNLFCVTCESSGRCVILVGSFWGVPVSDPPSDLLKSWGGGGVTGTRTVHGQDWWIGPLYILWLLLT